jgi:hypothetical protein
VALYDPAAHEPLTDELWDEVRAREGIADIVEDAVTGAGAAGFWPLHPLDDPESLPPEPTTLYIGAAGMIWGLWSLAATGHAEVPLDLDSAIQSALERYRTHPDFGSPAEADPRTRVAVPSLWMGETGIALVAHQLTADDALVEPLLTLIRSNNDNPTNELMWGSPGTMLAAATMLARTGDPRFAEAWYDGAERLWAHWNEDSLWIQQLYGRRMKSLGPAHGFAGVVRVLVQGGGFVDAIRVRVAKVVEERAVREDGLANWPPAADGELERNDTIRTQWCHGAPGIVASLWDVAPEELMVEGGELTWQAGPLKKGPGLCHGTAGNGYAFLKLHRLTRDEVWLERARRFAMHALTQVDRAREEYDQGRFTLWTGDIGVALYVRSCLEIDADVPTIDAW